jgi:carboxymethylenebutenolidase
MTPLQRYIVEEIAADHADGLLPRREALRRLGLLGVGATAAAALLAACSSDEQTTNPVTSTTDSPAPTPPGMSTAVLTTPVTFPGPDGRELQGAWAPAAQPRGAVLVIHENKGLTDHIRSVTGRFAGVGYSALAVDLLSEAGGTAVFTDPAEATAALGKIPQEQLVADLRAGIDELERRAPGKKLAAATPFYGPFPDNGDVSGSTAAVLAVYASLDARVDASRPGAEAALQRAGLPHEVFVAPDADHAFFNDTGPRYNQTAANEAWRRVLDWYGTRLS